MNHWTELVLSFATTLLGAFVMMDDARDWGKTDRLTHHVYVGFLIYFAGVVCMTVSVSRILQEANGMPVQPLSFNISSLLPQLLEAPK